MKSNLLSIVSNQIQSLVHCVWLLSTITCQLMHYGFLSLNFCLGTIFEFVLPLWDRVETCFSRECLIFWRTARNREPRSCECPNLVAVWAQKNLHKTFFFSNMGFDRLLSSTRSRLRRPFSQPLLNSPWRAHHVHNFCGSRVPNFFHLTKTLKTKRIPRPKRMLLRPLDRGFQVDEPTPIGYHSAIACV